MLTIAYFRRFVKLFKIVYLGKLVMGVVNFPVKQIGPFMSECLTLGVPDENGAVVLLAPTKEVPIGGRMF